MNGGEDSRDDLCRGQPAEGSERSKDLNMVAAVQILQDSIRNKKKRFKTQKSKSKNGGNRWLEQLNYLEDALNEQDGELMIRVEEERGGQVANTLLGKDLGCLGKIQSMDVGKRHLMAQHLAVNQPDQVFFHHLWGDPWLGEPGL